MTVIVTGAVVLVSLLAYFSNISLRKKLLREQATGFALQLSGELSRLNTRAADRKAWRAAAENLLLRPEVESVTVSDLTVSGDQARVIFSKSVSKQGDRGLSVTAAAPPGNIMVRVAVNGDSLNKARWSFIYMSAGVLLVVLLLVMFAGRFVLRSYLDKPLAQVRDGIEDIASGNYKRPFAPVAQRDIASIMQNISETARQIDIREKTLKVYIDSVRENVEELRKEVGIRKRAEEDLRSLNDELEERIAERTQQISDLSADLAKRFWDMAVEVSLANIVQRNLLPAKDVHLGNVFVSSIFEPASGLSGDIFEIIYFEKGKIGIMVADVMGHGLAAALITMMVKLPFLNNAAVDKGPGETLTLMNQELFQQLVISGSFFFTAFYAVIDETSGEMSYASAGHSDVLFYSNRKKRVNRFLPCGPGIGILQDVAYETRTMSVEIDDKLVAHTDGVIETQNEEGEIFGYKRLRNVIQQNAGQPAEELKQTILRSIEEFRGPTPPIDDVTIAVAEYRRAGTSTKTSEVRTRPG